MPDDVVLQTLDHIMDFQLNDLGMASVAKANFLVAVGCMNSIEFLGGVRNGLLGQAGNVERRFKEGVRLLGQGYTSQYLGVDTMYALRNGLTHQYVAGLQSYPQIFITNNDSDPTIVIIGNKLVLNVAGMVRDLADAWKRLRQELEQNPQKLELARQGLERLPELR
ncbi:MAG: hypothetical protein HY680_06685 [Chloroflexi bacterium]|nr:hypothetical protein [Chloroflexota bacterium]